MASQSSASCPSGWVANENSCYLFSNGRAVDFYEAAVYCQLHGSHLVTVETNKENIFLKDYLGRLNHQDYWMGLTDEMVEGVWRWLSSGAVASFTDWQHGEPNGLHGGEDCAHFKSNRDNRWNDEPCTYKHYPLCERSKTSPLYVG